MKDFKCQTASAATKNVAEPKLNDNVVKMPMPKARLTTDDVNSLFLGLVRLIRSMAEAEVRELVAAERCRMEEKIEQLTKINKNLIQQLNVKNDAASADKKQHL